MTQTRPESGMNPYPPIHNSFLGNSFSSYFFIVTLEGIMNNG